jgi:hypothetical protein
MPNGDTTFPIALNALNKSGNPRGLVHILPSVDPVVETFVQTVQPYVIAPSSPTTQPLGALARLNNIDKHHELPIMRTGVMAGTYVLDSAISGIFRAGNLPPVVTEGGRVIDTFPVSGIPPDVKMRLVSEPGIAIEIDGIPIPVIRGGFGGDGLTQLINGIVTWGIVPLIGLMKNL